MVHNGLIDSNYRSVILNNTSNRPSQVLLFGKLIAQIVISKVGEIEFLEVSELTKTKRNVSGFG